MNNLNTYFNTGISFDKHQDGNPNIADSNLNIATRFFSEAGDFFLAPARQLFKGKSVKVLLVPIAPGQARPMFHHVSESGGVLKTLGSIVFFLPGAIIGGIMKGAALMASDRLRRRHETAAAFIKSINIEPKMRQTHEVMTSLAKEDIPRLRYVLNQLRNQGKLDEFLKYFENNSVIFFPEYRGLFETYGRNVIVSREREMAITAFLKLFAEGRIADDEFKSKFEALDKLGRATRDNQFQVVDRSWIDTHIKTDMTLQDIANDIFSQLAQGKKEV